MTGPTEDIANSARESGGKRSMARLVIDAIEGRLAELHTGLPAKVEKFDAATQSVDVKPLLVRVVLDENDEPVEMPLPVITHVPVIYPAGSGWSITWPLKPGDIVFLAFAERSLDDWLSAPAGLLVTPAQSRKHDLSDAIAIPGIRPRTSAIPNVSEENLRIANDVGTVVIELSSTAAQVKAPTVNVDASMVNVGEGADSAFVRHTDWVAYNDAHIHLTALGPSSPPVVPGATIPSIASTKAKVK